MKYTQNDKRIMQACRDIFYDNAPALTVYLGEMESATSTDAETVTVDNTVRKVMSVWLASDTGYSGTNYYTDPKAENFTGSTITLDESLPVDTIDVNVAYYSDCETCGWDPYARTGRDSGCADCDGTGMTLELGTALSVPAKRVPRGGWRQPIENLGEETAGIIYLRVQAEYENALKAAMETHFAGQQIKEVEDGAGITIRREYNVAGEFQELLLIARYEP